jgi:hypothetical protein
MINWKEKVQDRHMEGSTPFGPVFIRLDRAGKVTGMYTLFGSTVKYIPDEEWMQDLVGAQLKLEEITYREKNTREWGDVLRSK